MAMLALALAGNPFAAQFVAAANLSQAQAQARPELVARVAARTAYDEPAAYVFCAD